MSVAFFIARKFFGYKSEGKQVSRPAVNIAIAGIALGLAVMIISVCVVMGFKREIRAKVVGFGSHIEVLNTQSLTNPESLPIEFSPDLTKRIRALPGVTGVQRFSLKTGMLKTEEDFQAVMLKGIGEEYDTDFIRQHIVAGTMPRLGAAGTENEVVISRSMAGNLNLKVGDRIYAYFFEEAVKTRRFLIKGLYETNMSRFDDALVFANINTVSKLNGWVGHQYSGVDISLSEYDQLETVAQQVRKITNPLSDAYGQTYAVQTITERYPQVFSWLELLDVNVLVILGLMIAVASFTMISGLLILILERTSAIGTLKALGAGNGMLRRVFLYFAVFLIGRGMLIGNVIAFVLLFVQAQWGVVKLDPTTYYISSIPVEFNIWICLLINLCTLILTILSLIAPSFLVSRIQPAKTIRFD